MKLTDLIKEANRALAECGDLPVQVCWPRDGNDGTTSRHAVGAEPIRFTSLATGEERDSFKIFAWGCAGFDDD